MSNILRFSVLFLLLSVVLSLFGAYVETLFLSFNGVLTYISSGNIGLVLTTLLSYLGWLLDLLFLNNSLGYTNLKLAPSVVIPSISWALTFFRILLGCTIFVLLLSLILNGRE